MESELKQGMEEYLNITSSVQAGDNKNNSEDNKGLHPKKYADYFASMSPLASRVYADIKKAENKVHNFEDLSFDDKCTAIDKHLHTGKEHVSHTEAMLLSVYPKKEAEEEEETPTWMKGFKGKFTACCENQIAACNLGKLLKKVSLRKAERKVQKSFSFKKGKAPVPSPFPSKLSAESIGGHDVEIVIPIKAIEERKPESRNEVQVESEKDDDNDAPKPKQNLDLIAELQAKFNKNKVEGAGTNGMFASSPTSKHHIPKPRAPPPPPPPPLRTGKVAIVKEGNGAPPMKTKKDQDEFVVDVSSPCRMVTRKTGFDFLDNW